jgi:hypothetical protein
MEFIKQNIYYLNLNELSQICTKANIPYKVYYRYNSKVNKSNILLRKKYIIKNILKRISNKKINKYIIPEINVSFEKQNKVKLSDNIYFGQFKWTYAKNKIFPKTFKPVICHFMLYDLWKMNKTFTYEQFIKFYNSNQKTYENMEHPEWKYISDTKEGSKNNDWKNKRNKIAKKVISRVSKLVKL